MQGRLLFLCFRVASQSGKGFEKQIFFNVREKWEREGLQKSLIIGKGNVVSKNIKIKPLVSVALLALKDLSWMLSEKSGDFLYL